MNRTKRSLIVATLVLVIALASAAVANAITWGEPDGDAHPYVGTLLFEQTTGFYSCSGTLLPSPTPQSTAFLTNF